MSGFFISFQSSMHQNRDKVTVSGIELNLSQPVNLDVKWIGQREPLQQLLACWLTLSDSDQPLSPRVVGAPGLGKTTLCMAAARQRKQDLYIFQCTADTRPEDLLITPVLGKKNTIQYHASPLMSAIITGGAAILDEGNRMPEKSWASLASLLDDRKMVESIIAGIHVKASKAFRCVVTMNDDSSTYEVPDYIMSRLQPAIELRPPDKNDELQILKYNIPDAPEELLNICVGYLQRAHGLELPYSIRDGINAVRYARRLQTLGRENWQACFDKAVTQILGEEALDLDKLAMQRKTQGAIYPKMQLGDFFFGEDDPMNPDNPEN